MYLIILYRILIHVYIERYAHTFQNKSSKAVIDSISLVVKNVIKLACLWSYTCRIQSCDIIFCNTLQLLLRNLTKRIIYYPFMFYTGVVDGISGNRAGQISYGLYQGLKQTNLVTLPSHHEWEMVSHHVGIFNLIIGRILANFIFFAVIMKFLMPLLLMKSLAPHLL